MEHHDFVHRKNESAVTIDFTGITSEAEVHELFAKALSFPEFYGRNWDAFWDVLVGFGCFPPQLILQNTKHLSQAVPRAFERLRSLLDECSREYSQSAPIVIWK